MRATHAGMPPRVTHAERDVRITHALQKVNKEMPVRADWPSLTSVTHGVTNA